MGVVDVVYDPFGTTAHPRLARNTPHTASVYAAHGRGHLLPMIFLRWALTMTATLGRCACLFHDDSPSRDLIPQSGCHLRVAIKMVFSVLKQAAVSHPDLQLRQGLLPISKRVTPQVRFRLVAGAVRAHTM